MMRSVVCVAMCLVLFPSLLAAEKACESRQSAPSLEAIRIVSDTPAAVGAELLFYEFPNGLAVGEGQRIRVETRTDGLPNRVETLRVLRGEDSGRTVVELFSRHPEEVAALRRLAGRGVRVEIEVSVGGVSADLLTYGELIARNAELRMDLPLPRSVVSVMASAGAEEELESIAGAALTCEELCELDWEDCYIYRCDYGSSPSCLDACDVEYQNCLASCQPPPPCEPTTEIVYVNEPISYYSLGIDCFYDVFYPFDGWQFDEQVWTFKRTKKQITHNCDGTDTVVVLSVTYFNDYCYDRWFWSCSGPFIRNRLGSCWY